jgi:hypothetical protein
MSSQSSCAEGFVPNAAIFRERTIESWGVWPHEWINPSMDLWLNEWLGRNFRRWGLVGESRSLEMSPGRVHFVPGSFPSVLFFFLSLLLTQSLSRSSLWFLAAMRYTALFYYMLSTIMFCLSTGPEIMESSDHELKLLKPWAKIHLSSFKLIFLHILSQQQKVNRLFLCLLLMRICLKL